MQPSLSSKSRFKGRTKREQYQAIRQKLASERTSFESVWRECGEYILPKSPQFFAEDSNRGERRDQSIIDSTGTLAARSLRSGMMSGITSPARPWFNLGTPDPKLSEIFRVKEWLDLVTTRMRRVLTSSNFYKSLPILYGDLGVFGTAAILVEEDFEYVLRTYPLPIGSYYISNNSKLKVDTFYREFRLTVRQVVEKFAGNEGIHGELTGDGRVEWRNISSRVQEAYERGDMEDWVNICHIIQPNPDYNPNRPQSKYKRYLSCYYEAGYSSTSSSQGNYLDPLDQDKYLLEKGYDFFPVLCPRWEMSSGDTYATSWPALDAIGDIKQLQIGERRLLAAIDKMVDPPMRGPTSLKAQRASIIPGDITYNDGQNKFEPIYQPDPRILELENKQAQVRQRIQRGFYEDLFLMLATLDDRQRTAREIAERHEEKLLALGPVLEQLNQDLLDPMIDLTFEFMVRQGLIPPPPEELQGIPLKVEYISIMAQAQKLTGLAGMDRFTNYAMTLVGAFPEAAMKLRVDKMLDYYGDVTGIPAGVLRPEEEVEEMKAQQQEAMAQQAQMEQLRSGATAAKDLSQTSMESDSALNRLLEASAAGELT